MSNQWNLDRIMRLIFITVAIVFGVKLLSYLSGVLVPFVVALLVAYILDPIVAKVQKKVKYRIVAVITVLLTLGSVLSLCFAFFIPRVSREVRHLGNLISRLFTDSAWSQRISEYIPANIWDNIREILSQERLINAVQSLDFWNAVESVLAKILPGAMGVLSGTATVVFWLSGLLFILLYLVFIMLDMPKMKAKLLYFTPKRYHEEINIFAQKMDELMNGYFRAQMLVAMIVGILFAIAFSIMKLPMGFLFGIFIGALNMIPYLQILSIPLALVLGVVYALDTGMPFWEVALIITAIYVGIQLLQDLIIVPNVVGKSMNLPPVAILLSLSVWGKLLGFLGLVVAIPFSCLVLVYLERFKQNKSAQAFFMAAEDKLETPESCQKEALKSK